MAIRLTYSWTIVNRPAGSNAVVDRAPDQCYTRIHSRYSRVLTTYA